MEANDLNSAFVSFIGKNNIFSRNHRLLLAFSGGVDSSVLAHLLLENGYTFDLAHANFKLRGQESDQDQAFVKNFANQNHLTLHLKSFDTRDYASEKGISIEMAARELRYQWFEKLKKSQMFDYVLLAHHLNDSLETVLLNLTKGTGIRGLTGIDKNRDFYLRPLSAVPRILIEEYVTQNKIAYRVDSSNNDNRFQRNKIRNEIIPALKQINPSLEQSFVKTLNNLNEVSKFYDQQISIIEQKMRLAGEDLSYDLKVIENNELRNFVLYSIVSPYGFNRQQIDSLWVSYHSQMSGKYFYSDSYELLLDRNIIQISPKNLKTSNELIINQPGEVKFGSYILNLGIIDRHQVKDLKDPNHAYLNIEKIKFPIKIRTWKEGDSFIPFGLKGSKKLSDFFIDLKMNRSIKSQIPLIISDNKIVWVAGYRIDDRFKIDNYCAKVLKIVLTKI